MQNDLGEGLVWNAVEQRLYWVEFLAERLHHLHPANGAQEVLDLGERICPLAFREQGSLVFTIQNGFAFWDPRTNAQQKIGDPVVKIPGTHFNDGAVDRGGRF